VIAALGARSARLRDVRAEAGVGAARAARGRSADRARGRAHARELPNGLLVLVHEDHRLPRVSIALTWRAVPRSRRPPRRARCRSWPSCSSAARASATRSPTPRRSTRSARLRRERRLGHGRLGIAGLSRDFDVLLDLFADAALRPRFDAREAQRARAALLASLERAKDDPATLAGWHASRAVYGAHRFALPVSGPRRRRRGSTRSARAPITQKLFVPNGRSRA
jgi:hypothetical protein